MSTHIPAILQNIPHPPKRLFITGVALKDILDRPRIAIVGSRKVSIYGENITTNFATELAKQGVVIVSGLAFGVDALAHKAALETGGLTVAILPMGLDKIYPSAHRQLARRITKQGTLLSEYPDGTTSFKGNFVARNRLVSGISDAILITEAAEHSGTLHTARFAQAQGRKVFAIPGNITSPLSKGTNSLIKAGASAVTDPADILHALGLGSARKSKQKPCSDNPHEQQIIDLLYAGITDSISLLRKSGFDVPHFNQALTALELSGIIIPLGSGHWRFAE